MHIQNKKTTLNLYIAEGVKIRSKCPWYEEHEKSTKFFLVSKKNDPLKRW